MLNDFRDSPTARIVRTVGNSEKSAGDAFLKSPIPNRNSRPIPVHAARQREMRLAFFEVPEEPIPARDDTPPWQARETQHPIQCRELGPWDPPPTLLQRTTRPIEPSTHRRGFWIAVRFIFAFHLARNLKYVCTRSTSAESHCSPQSDKILSDLAWLSGEWAVNESSPSCRGNA